MCTYVKHICTMHIICIEPTCKAYFYIFTTYKHICLHVCDNVCDSVRLSVTRVRIYVPRHVYMSVWICLQSTCINVCIRVHVTQCMCEFVLNIS